MRISIILPYYNRKPLLRLTLDSFSHFYAGKDLEVVVVDDTSSEEHRIEDLPSIYPGLNIVTVRIPVKNGINPCYPYNVGVRKSSGDIIILSSPETFHTSDMFEATNSFAEMSDNVYMLLSVFCITENGVRDMVLSSIPFAEKLKRFSSVKPLLPLNLGLNGYSFANQYGSWYTHSKFRPSRLNFFSALTKKTYCSIGGFDERFRFGTGFDDDDFRDRLLKVAPNIKWFDDVVGIHVNHEIVNNMPPTTNMPVFEASKTHPYINNNMWGMV